MALVLIVEDDRDVCRMIDLLLRTEGFETMCASNGAQALSQMRERHPCLVLLDIHMPVMDGFAFRRWQLADPNLSAVPVLCLTAHYDPASVERELRVPCLRKPVHFPELVAQVKASCR